MFLFTFFVVSLTVVNINIIKDKINCNITIQDLITMSEATAEEGYPIGKYCGRDTCSKACGMPPFVYTADGHYWHCKWQDMPGTCIDAMCNKECDAMCFE